MNLKTAASADAVEMAVKILAESENDRLQPPWSARDVAWARWVIDQANRRKAAAS